MQDQKSQLSPDSGGHGAPLGSTRNWPGERFTILVLGTLTAFAPMSIDMYLPAFPAMAAEYQADEAAIQLSLSSFLLCFGLGQLFWGPLSDRLGRKWPAVTGILIYIAACVGCAAAATPATLIGWRALQALGSCAAPAIARAMVRDRYEGDRIAAVLSLMWLVMGVAPMVAPILGGQVMAWLGWRAIFWALGLFGAVTLAGLLCLPETLPPERRRRGSVRLLIEGYATLLTSGRFLGPALCAGCMFGGMFAYISGTPFIYIEYFHVPAERYGLLFGLNVLGMLGMATINSRIVLKAGTGRLLRLGISVAAVASLALVATAASGLGGLVGIVIPLFFYISMVGIIGSNATAASLADVPHLAGTAAALIGTMQFGLGAIAGAAVGTLADGTPLPMAGVICVLALTGSFFGLALIRRR